MTVISIEISSHIKQGGNFTAVLKALEEMFNINSVQTKRPTETFLLLHDLAAQGAEIQWNSN